MAKTDAKSNFGVRGWIFVIYSFLTFFFTTATSDSISNLALPALCEKYGWVYENMVSWKSVWGWITVIFLAACGQLLRKISPKKTATVLALIYGVGAILLPHVSAKAIFILIYGITGIGATVWGQQLNGALTSNWFPRKKGLVIGWTTAGFPLGSGLGVLLYNLISRGGQNMPLVYHIYGGIIVILGLVVAFCITDYPEQCGCFPDNDKNMTREQADAILAQAIEASKKSIWTPKKMLSIKESWFIAISNGLSLFFCGTMSVLIPRLMAAGFSMQQAIPIMTVTAVLGGVGSYVMGLIDTKWGPKNAMIFMDILAIVASILNIISWRPGIYIAIVFTGMVLGGSANLLMSLITSMWGRYSFINAHGVLLPINQLLGSAGTITVAQVAARYSYSGAYIVVGIVSLLSLLFILPVKEDSILKYEKEAGYERPELHDGLE